MSSKIASGSTPPGSTAWQQYHNGAGVFTAIPLYLTSLGGESHHWATTGATSIYFATPTKFTVFVRWANGAPLTPAQANGLQWRINWLGIQS